MATCTRVVPAVAVVTVFLIASLVSVVDAQEGPESFSVRGVGFTEVDRFERCDLVGTDGDDVLRPEPGQVTCGLGGDDVIFGTDGVDFVDAGAGNDTIYGGAGNDVLVGEQGDDVIYGGSGDDRLLGSLIGLSGDLIGGVGADRLIGGPGDDEIGAGSFAGGNYFPIAGPGSLLVGGPDVDKLFGTTGADRIYVGGRGGLVNGFSGDDFLVGAGGDTGAVTDSICVAPSLAAEVASGIGVVVENNFSLSATNVLIGGFGDDTIVSGGGRSCIAGFSGSDVIYGSEFGDSIAAGGVKPFPTSTPAPGGDPSDTDFVFAKGGDDVLFGSAGADLVYGGVGADVFVDDRRADGFTELPGDQLRPDLVRLGGGDDRVFGGPGDDELDGGPGSDTILGGGGEDWLWPGRDSDEDVLDGQAGKDGCGVFVYDSATCEHVSERSL